MKIKIDEMKSASNSALHKLGFSEADANLITRNLIEAELVGKKTHGLIRIPALKKQIESGKVSVDSEIETISESPTHLHLDGKNKPGFIVIYQSLEKAITKAKSSGMVTVGLKDVSYASGFIGDYAREATKENLIFIGFNNSAGGLVPYGLKKELWGTNPMTVGVPTNSIPVILDMASSQITWGELMLAKQENRTIKENVAIDADGKATTDPSKAMEGGLTPFAGHKGSGLAFIIELLAGALTGSRVGYAVPGGWGTFYILINPEIFRPIADFKADIQKAIEELKLSPKAEGFSEVYYAGEQSGKLREKHLKEGVIEVNDSLWESLKTI